MKIILNRRNISLMITGTLLTLLIGFSFAYFIGTVGSSAITDTSIIGEKESRLRFTPGAPINLYSSIDNFSEGAGSLTGESSSTATLTSSSKEEVVSDEYFAYYYISNNSYLYTHNSSTPELILEVFDNDGNKITNVDGLTYVTTTDALTGDTINGFDVTTYTGLIPIKENMPISATNPDDTTHEWNIKITYLNLNTNQSLNEGKSLSGDLILSPRNIFLLDNQVVVDNGGISAIEAKLDPDFSQIATLDEGLFAEEDELGTSYYYRGAVDDNWVSFAGFYWRIVRINGDSTIRLIYSGVNAPTEEEAVVKTGDDTGIGLYTYNNTSYLNNIFVGYMYSFDEQHGYYVNSNAKATLDLWYEDNLMSYSDNIADSIFCNDRSTYSGTGLGTSITLYSAYNRLRNNKTPTYNCTVEADKFTTESTLGNGHLTYPIGLLTADELSYAGGVTFMANSEFYLNTNQKYWTMTPYTYYDNNSSAFVFSPSSCITSDPVYIKYSLRPVISLISNSIAYGTGTWDDPYVIL